MEAVPTIVISPRRKPKRSWAKRRRIVSFPHDRQNLSNRLSSSSCRAKMRISLTASRDPSSPDRYSAMRRLAAIAPTSEKRLPA